MFIGVDCFGESFDVYNVVNNYYRLELSNSIIDETNIRSRTDLDITNSNKTIWQYDNILLALYKDNLEAGNVNLNGIEIEYIKLKKRKIEDLQWQELKNIQLLTGVYLYEYIDKYVESLQDYEYAIQPIGAGGIIGNNIIAQIECKFEGTWLLDKDKQYKLLYNLNVGDYETIIPNTIIETLGGQYPFVFTNGNIKYRKGNIRCSLLSDSTINTGNIDRKQEKFIRKSIMDFLTDKKPKIYKDSSGEFMVISIIGNPVLSPNNNLSQQIYDIGINFVEIANSDSQSLIDNGLLVL